MPNTVKYFADSRTCTKPVSRINSGSTPPTLSAVVVDTWTVIAVVAGREIVSPDPSSPEMKFQVLSTNGVAQLNKLKKARSHLALGVFYSREGMIPEAEGEFRIVVRENPNSEHANKLLREIQSWQRP